MVAARRCFDGQVELAEMTRLQGLVADTEGKCTFALEFGHDDILRVSYVDLTIDTELPLICQRSLQRFLLPVSVKQRLGLIRNEDEESSLPEEYEAMLVPEDGSLRPLDLVEDELVPPCRWCRCRPRVKRLTGTGHRPKKNRARPIRSRHWRR